MFTASRTSSEKPPSPDRPPARRASPRVAAPANQKSPCPCGGGCPRCHAASHGAPLDARVRQRFESGLGASLADVRVHTDDRAAASAAALNAEAYSIGRDVVFGAGRFQPSSPEGSRLLAHELTHVVQQGSRQPSDRLPPISRPGDAAEREAHEAAGALVAGERAHISPGSAPFGVYRQPLGGIPPTWEATAQIRQWLEEHQFAPPSEQPREGERHVLLNGSDMTLTDAVHLAAAGVHQPEDTVRAVISSALTPPPPVSARTAPWVGIGTGVPGLALFPQTFQDRLAINKAFELNTVDDWLTAHHFYQLPIPDPTGFRVMLDGQPTDINTVADRVMAILGNAGPIRVGFLSRQEVLYHLRQQYVAAPQAPGKQILIGYTLVPRIFQTVAPAADALNPLRDQHQFSLTMTWAHHDSDSPGLETSIQGSVTFDNDGHIMNLQAGVQEAAVLALFNGWVQVSGLAQLMVSANWNRTAIGGVEVDPGIQGAVGAQILLNPQVRPVRLLNGHVSLAVPQVGLQALGTLGATSQGPQIGANAGIVVNVPFNIF